MQARAYRQIQLGWWVFYSARTEAGPVHSVLKNKITKICNKNDFQNRISLFFGKFWLLTVLFYHKSLRFFFVSSTFVLTHDIFLFTKTGISFNGNPTTSRWIGRFHSSLRMGRPGKKNNENSTRLTLSFIIFFLKKT